MKILQVVHQFPDALGGGTERYVAAVSAALRELGHEVQIACGALGVGRPHRIVEAQRHGFAVHELHRDDLYFESWEKAWCPDVGGAFRRLLERERPDVVHVHHWIRLTSDLVRIARNVGVPVVACTLHDHWTVLADPARPWGMVEAEAPAAPRWMGAAERGEAFAFHRDDLLDEVRAAHVRLVPSAAHAESLRALAPDDFGAAVVSAPPLLVRPPRQAPRSGPRGKRLLFWGSLYPAKGLELVLDALASIGSGWELHVLGDAPDPAYGELLRGRAAHFPVTFHGAFQPGDLAAIGADYAVVPAGSHESYGLVVDEAQCVGLPLIAADLPAFREHCPAASCAWFEPNDAGSLAMLLLDESRLAGLQVPEPAGASADDAARALLDAYDGVRDGRHAPVDGPQRAHMRARARQLFRRAERRLWSALQDGDLRTPPDEFLK